MRDSRPASKRWCGRVGLLSLALGLVGPLTGCQRHEASAGTSDVAQPLPNQGSATPSGGADAGQLPVEQPVIVEPSSAAPSGPDLLAYPVTGEAPGVVLLGTPLPSVAHDVGVAPDGQFTADRVEFGDGNGCLLLPARGVPAAGGRFAAELWVRGKQFAEGAAVDVFLIDERKELAYQREVVPLTDAWQQVRLDHVFEASDSDSSVALRLGNNHELPSPVELWFWSPQLVRESAEAPR